MFDEGEDANRAGFVSYIALFSYALLSFRQEVSQLKCLCRKTPTEEQTPKRQRTLKCRAQPVLNYWS